jgi:hypothetical protein
VIVLNDSVYNPLFWISKVAPIYRNVQEEPKGKEKSGEDDKAIVLFYFGKIVVFAKFSSNMWAWLK